MLSYLYVVSNAPDHRKESACMSDKELATHIYLSTLKAIAIRTSDPNYSGDPFYLPSLKKMIDDINELASVISTMQSV